MKYTSAILFFAIFLFCLSACSTTRYYIVRHAEKAAPNSQMTNDLPLSEAGLRRAEKLQKILASKKINQVYATATLRAMQTAKPTSDYHHVIIIPYDHKNHFDHFIDSLQHQTGNSLIVGHSNSIDDITNALMAKKVLSDFDESVYNQLIRVTKKGKRSRLKIRTY